MSSKASLMAIFETSPAPVTDLFKFLVIDNKESLKFVIPFKIVSRKNSQRSIFVDFNN